jgi:hypothetical protein
LTSRIVGNLKAERDQNFKRTSVSVGGYKSGSQRDRRSESHDKNSGYSYDEKMEMGAWEYETGASGKHLKSRSDLTVGDDSMLVHQASGTKPLLNFIMKVNLGAVNGQGIRDT